MRLPKVTYSSNPTFAMVRFTNTVHTSAHGTLAALQVALISKSPVSSFSPLSCSTMMHVRESRPVWSTTSQTLELRSTAAKAASWDRTKVLICARVWLVKSFWSGRETGATVGAWILVGTVVDVRRTQRELSRGSTVNS